MVAANIAPIDRKCAWHAPEIVSCLLSARETLVAGLVAAGGAIFFAAWLVWSVIRDHIDFGMARDAALKEDIARGRIERAESELVGLRLMANHINRFIGGFKGVDASSEWKYVDDLRKLAKGGHLSFYAQPMPAPLVGKVGYLSNKMNQLASRIERVDTDPSLRNTSAPTAMSPALRSEHIELDRAIKFTLGEYVTLREEFRAEIQERRDCSRLSRKTPHVITSRPHPDHGPGPTPDCMSSPQRTSCQRGGPLRSPHIHTVTERNPVTLASLH